MKKRNEEQTKIQKVSIHNMTEPDHLKQNHPERSGLFSALIQKRWIKRLLCIAVVLATAIPFLIWQSTGIELNTLSYQSDHLPQVFHGFKILQISDLHNNEYGKGQKKLLQMTKEAQPDMIAITGDFIDRNDVEHAVDYARGAVEIAPVFYVPGNHEAEHREGYEKLKKELISLGVVVLEDDSVTLTRADSKIRVIGLLDPDFSKSENEKEAKDVFAQKLGNSKPDEMFSILLSHRPELMDVYQSKQVDLAFSGHAHGGLIRLPGVGALFAIDQDIFPKYTKGLYQEGDTAMVVSGGAGNGLSSFFRLFNRPELVLTTLYSKPLSVTVEDSISGSNF